MLFYNLLDVPVRYGATCPYNYLDQLWFAFLLFLAGSALWLGKWWSYLGAALICGTKVVYFVGFALLVFSGANSSEESSVTPEIWIQFMSNNPDQPLQILLAAVIAVFSVFGLAQLMFRKRLVLS